MGADTTLVIALAAVGAALAARVLLARVTVFEYQRGLLYRYGRFKTLLGPGTHWIYRPATAVQTVDVRETLMPLTGQELVSADGVSIKISLAARYRVGDPVRAINNVAGYLMLLHSLLQVALREVVGQQPIDQLLQQRDEIGGQTLARAAGPASELGVELLRVDAKDLMLRSDEADLREGGRSATGGTRLAGEGARRDRRPAQPCERSPPRRGATCAHAAAPVAANRRLIGEHRDPRRALVVNADPSPRRADHGRATAVTAGARGAVTLA